MRTDCTPRARPIPGFVVTSLGRQRADARTLYEALYRARGEMENRIKECQLDLFATCPERSRRDRTSTATMRATNCACGSPQWPMCCSKGCAVSASRRQSSPTPLRRG